MLRFVAVLLLVAGCGLAGDWQVSAGGGFGAYHPVTLSGPPGTAQAGIGPRFVLNVAIGRQISRHLAIEGAWTFQDGDFEIASGDAKIAFDASGQSAHADLLGYLRERSSRWRPFLVAGSGVKFYTGWETPTPRPLAEFGSFRQRTDCRALLLFGGGMEWSLSTRWALRLELADYATPFPSGVIVPAAGVHSSGWLHDFVPVLDVTFR